MRGLIELFLSIPVGGRAVVFIGLLFVLWCIFGRFILKFVSILPWLLKKISIGIYILLEIPISVLHNKFGGAFGEIDQGLAAVTEKVCAFMDKWYEKMHSPRTIYCGRGFIVYLVIVAYLVIPIFTNLTEKPFTFWQESYMKNESEFFQWMDDKGWLDK